MPKTHSRELTELIFTHPCCRFADAVKADIAKRQTEAVYLKALAAAGIFKAFKTGREKLFVNQRLVALFAESE